MPPSVAFKEINPIFYDWTSFIPFPDQLCAWMWRLDCLLSVLFLGITSFFCLSMCSARFSVIVPGCQITDLKKKKNCSLCTLPVLYKVSGEGESVWKSHKTKTEQKDFKSFWWSLHLVYHSSNIPIVSLILIRNRELLVYNNQKEMNL